MKLDESNGMVKPQICCCRFEACKNEDFTVSCGKPLLMKRTMLAAAAVAFSLMVMAANFGNKTGTSEQQMIAPAAHPGWASATCTGAKNCRACKNCKYCKHCKKDGGTCGVCK